MKKTNGHKQAKRADVPAVQMLQPHEVATLLEQRSQELLGLSGEKALRKLKEGELRGKAAIELEMLRFLRDD